MADIEYLSERADNNRMWTPAAAFRSAAAEVESGDWQEMNKGIAIALHHDGQNYRTVFTAANLSNAEIIALLRVISLEFEMQLVDVE